jgi:hypothetical protein
LIHAQIVGPVKIKYDELHGYVYRLAFGGKPPAKNFAIAILSSFNREEDVDEILALAKDAEGGTFRASVVALTTMCNAESHKAVAELVNFLTNRDAKEFVEKWRDRTAEVRENNGPCSEPAF